MILVNNQWYVCESLNDLAGILREEGLYELAKELESNIPLHSDDDYYSLESECNELENNLENAEDKCSYHEQRVEELERKIEELDKKKSLDKEVLRKILAKYFDLGDSYVYNLTRDKKAFSTGTMALDDFQEFNDYNVDDLVNYIVKNY